MHASSLTIESPVAPSNVKPVSGWIIQVCIEAAVLCYAIQCRHVCASIATTAASALQTSVKRHHALPLSLLQLVLMDHVGLHIRHNLPRLHCRVKPCRHLMFIRTSPYTPQRNASLPPPPPPPQRLAPARFPASPAGQPSSSVAPPHTSGRKATVALDRPAPSAYSISRPKVRCLSSMLLVALH